MDKYGRILWLIVLITLPLLAIGQSPVTILVDKDNGSSSAYCWSDKENNTCKFLDDALAGVQSIMNYSSPIVILLFPGEHLLGPNTSLSTFHNARNFTIRGEAAGAENVTVSCDHRNGFAFTRSKALTFENLTLRHCLSQSGMPAELKSKNPNTNIALALYNCDDVTMRHVTVRDNNGIGVILFNTLGTNIFHNCTFMNNQDHNVSDKNAGRAFSGMVVLFFYCVTGTPQENCSYYINASDDFSPLYDIADCHFIENNSTYGDLIEPRLITSVSLDRYREHVSKGGGLSILMHGYSSNTTFQIRQCTFSRNSASWGGGVHLCFRDYSRNNTVHFEGCSFDSNFSPTRSQPGGSHGGGANIVYLQKDDDDVVNNRVSFSLTHFVNNTALFGGGISVQVSEVQAKLNNVSFRHCVFVNNTANVGAAGDLSVSFLTAHFGEKTGRTLALFENCKFNSNTAMPARVALNQTSRIGNGALYIFQIQTMFEGFNYFVGNIGTGLVLATWATLNDNSLLHFEGNIGSVGGGLRFSGQPRLDVRNNTTLNFIRNEAKYLGGALYASYSDVHNEVYQSSCFIRQFSDKELVNPDEWNSTFLFENNTCMNKRNSVWVSSLIPCYWLDSESNDSISNTFCWKNWNYVGSTCHAEISSRGTELVSDAALEFFPGIPQQSPLVIRDDLGHDVSDETILTAKVTSGEGEVQDSAFYRADSNITLLGLPNTSIALSLQMQGPSGFIQECNITFLPCPPGFVAQQQYISFSSIPLNQSIKCVCGGNYHSTVQCNRDALSATIMNGFSMSYNNTLEKTVVGAVPYEIYSSVAGLRPLPRTVLELDEAMCGELNRTGILCSQCQAGLSVKMSFTSLECINCTTGLAGSWFIFFAEQLLPITIFFLFVILGNINAASAPFNGFIFFSQVMANPLSYRLENPWIHSIGSRHFVYSFTLAEDVLFIPYSIWNLDFKLIRIFHQDICFVSGNHILVHTSLEYINALYPLLLIGASYVLINLHDMNFKPVVWLWKPFRACFLKFKRTWNPKLSIINAFATFVIVSYVEFLATSVKLLASVQLYGSDSALDYRYFFDASKDYLGPEHLPFAILAIVVLCVVILPPPILMFLYPLKPVQKAIGAMNCKCCNWHGLRTFVEAIQGGFKDGTNGTRDCRFFSGLYFVFRIVLILVLGVATSFLHQYLFTICFLMIMILLFVLFQPYKDSYYNKFDTAIIVIMLGVHVTNFFNVYANIAEGAPSVALWAISQVILALPLFYVIFVEGIQLIWRRIKRTKYWREFGKKKHRPLNEEDSFPPTPSYQGQLRKRKRPSLVSIGQPGLVTITEVNLTDSDEMPDRLINPTDYGYESLEKHIDNSQPVVESPLTDSQNTLYGSLEEERLLGSQEMLELSKT